MNTLPVALVTGLRDGLDSSIFAVALVLTAVVATGCHFILT